MINEKFYEKIEVGDWKKLIETYNNYFKPEKGRYWIFRGDKTVHLKTKLEKAVISFELDKTKLPEKCDPTYEEKKKRFERKILKKGLLKSNGKSYQNVFKFESNLRRKFKRQCHHYSINIPKEKDKLGWYAMMQHYGAPTRLLDWTYSFFVAVYFSMHSIDSECIIWGINEGWINKTVISILNKKGIKKDFKNNFRFEKPVNFDKLFERNKPIPLVNVVNPLKLNERLVIQQGVFLCPGDISIPFEDNLRAILEHEKKKSKKEFFMIKIDKDLIKRKEILYHLHRMNLNNATLFPGIVGYAESMRSYFSFPDILSPEYK